MKSLVMITLMVVGLTAQAQTCFDHEPPKFVFKCDSGDLKMELLDVNNAKVAKETALWGYSAKCSEVVSSLSNVVISGSEILKPTLVALCDQNGVLSRTVIDPSSTSFKVMDRRYDLSFEQCVSEINQINVNQNRVGAICG